MSAIIPLLLPFLAATALSARQWQPQTIENPGRDTTPQPLWYPQFQVNFNETMSLFSLLQAHTQGKWWYDAVAKAEVIDRLNGQGDRYCGSIHPLTRTPCRHLVTRGNRYLIFPELKQCCLCCVAAQGCGILSPRWLDDAEFQGTTHLYGKEVYKWSKKGVQGNFYYSTADEAQLPVELYQVPNDRQTLNTSTFSPEGVTPDLIEVPRYCKPRCPLASVCTFLDSGGEGGEDQTNQEPF
ncbi:hypothetical protein DUNSADRAFT_12616 [Dunaliella salina]|uniref:Uncharacterized protein n=1 Tax=Dunaliella salina TaxID=3046 RepID=A0ABQ7GAW4_DUNSA|nr:hypothetical protein DUNSADRAFT_12616 [Dunaliella salina]|eukprot:KAF5831746.1 hypothetical protein DUNSADRAFT_12616 [Dunaliella salina]